MKSHITTRSFLLGAFLFVFAFKGAGAEPANNANRAVVDDFPAMLERADAAQRELQNGHPEAFKALWSHADDITLSGGFGGTIEKGWEAISRRLDWVGTQFSNGTNTIDRVAAKAAGDLAYVVQVEHIRFRVPGSETETTRDYRVTMLFRREQGSWRIIHRQADSQMMKQAPK
jgi:ketosteroid isomerase-like protein